MSSSTSKGVSKLNNAVRRGDKDRVVELLDQGVDPNQFSDSVEPKSPLMVACENGHDEIVELLVERGAKVDLENGRHQTALLQAISSENVEMTKLLLKLKAKPKVRFIDSGLMTACKKGNVDLVKLLLPYYTWGDSGTDNVNLVFSEAVRSGHTKVVEFLLQSEHIDVALVKMVYLLHVACTKKDDPEMVKVLLDKKPDIVNCTLNTCRGRVDVNEKGFTGLMQASAKGHTKVVELLLDRGAEIDYQNRTQTTGDNNRKFEGHSALMVACNTCNLETVKLLLARGAKVDLLTKTGKSALMLSTKSDYEDLWRVRSPRNIDITEIIRLLLSKTANVDYQDEAGGTALVYAVNDRLLEAVKLLLEKNARTDIGIYKGPPPPYDQPPPLHGSPPLHLAICNSRSDPEITSEKIARLLLKRGSPVNLLDSHEKTPLIVACQYGQAELVQLLIKKGADIDHLDDEGGYALLYAAGNSELEIVELLLEKGAKADVKADNGESASDVMIKEKESYTKIMKSKKLSQKCPRLKAKLGITVTEQMDEQNWFSKMQENRMSNEEHVPSRSDEEQPMSEDIPLSTQTGSMVPSSTASPSTGPGAPPSSTTSPLTGPGVPPSSTASPSTGPGVPPSSTASSSTGPGVPPSSTASPTPIPTHAEVKRYLKSLSNTGIINVGVNLGLDYNSLKNVREDVMNEMISCWRREDDDVITTSGRPSWLSLVKALEEEGHNGVAAKIKNEKLSCS